MKQPSVLVRWASMASAALVLCGSALAQVSVGAELGSDRFWGGSVEKTGQQRSFRPFRPTTFGVEVERRSGRLALGLRLRYSSVGLALEGANGISMAKGIFTVYSAAPEVAYHVATLASVNRLVLHAGPLLEIWSVLDEGSETRIGAEGALSLSAPLGGRLEGSIRAGTALISSPFAREQLDANFERRALWRRRFAAGLEYRL